MWVAIFAIFVVGIPLCININSSRNKEPSEPKENMEFIQVFFHESHRAVSMDAEEYILGVLMAEMPAEFEFEALKAQCVAARTYLYSKTNSTSNNDAHMGCVICTDSAHCQAYISAEDAKTKWGKNASLYFEKCKKAVEETKGVIAVYKNEPINAVFHSFSNGKTENASDVWGNNVDYLKSVDSPGDLSAPKYESTVKLSIDKFKKIMKEKFECNFDNNFIGTVYNTVGGSVQKVIIGDKEIKGTEIRRVLNLRSSSFAINYTDDEIIFNVKGYGHGVGMSQYGANYCAKKGMNYEEILKKYYTGIELKQLKS